MAADTLLLARITQSAAALEIKPWADLYAQVKTISLIDSILKYLITQITIIFLINN